MFDNRTLIGAIHSAKFPYYNIKTQTMEFKFRPVLVVEVENQYGLSDVTALPLSRINDRSRIIADYDVKIQSHKYPELNLTAETSYVRTSKITTFSNKDLRKTPLAELSTTNPELYQKIITKMKLYVEKINLISA